tara:strand:+ start:133 stop:480 length:348 start_codon:yes stop_codon:yes gene_type:complete
MSVIEIISLIKIGGAIVGSSVATILLSKWLGRTKEEAELVLNWEQIHEKRDKKLLSEIRRLEDKLDEFMNQMETERATHKREILLWEESDKKKDIIIANREATISSLIKELEINE